MAITPDYANCSRAYLKITRTEHGSTCAPADIHAFDKAHGVGLRLEPSLTVMPQEVTLTSLAISMARIAESMETLEHIAYRTYKKTHGKRRWWKREKPNEA